MPELLLLLLVVVVVVVVVVEKPLPLCLTRRNADPAHPARHRLILGSVGGAVAGLRDSPSRLTKIRMNSMLNGASFWGSRLGNQAGVVALIYTFSKMVVEYSTITDRLGLGDAADSVVAGLSTGVIYKCMRGPRQMALFATAGAASMGALTVLSKQVGQRLGPRVSVAGSFFGRS